MASSTSLSNTPAASHSVRRARRVVSLALQSRAATSQQQPAGEPGQDGVHAVPVRDAQPVAAQRVRSGGRGGRWPWMAFQTAPATRGSMASKGPAVDSLKRQNPKYCYFEHGYFK